VNLKKERQLLKKIDVSKIKADEYPLKAIGVEKKEIKGVPLEKSRYSVLRRIWHRW
jgi:hypothetical protein